MGGSCFNLLPVQAEQSDMGRKDEGFPPAAISPHDSQRVRACACVCNAGAEA